MQAEVTILTPSGTPRLTATLSMAHPAATWGRPALIVDDVAYAPPDTLPWGQLAAEVTFAFSADPLVRELRRRWTQAAHGYLERVHALELSLGGAQ